MKASKIHIILLILIVIGAIVFSFNTIVVGDYANCEECLIGPIVYKDNLYFVSGEQSNGDKAKKLGYILDKSSPLEVIGCLFFADELSALDDNMNHLRVEGSLCNSYSKFSQFENEEYINRIFDKYSDFELLYPDQNGEFMLGSLDMPKDIITSLENQFRNINYNIKDFSKSHNNYYVYVKSPNKDSFDLKEDSYLYIGVIMEKDNNLYYGNLNNKIGQDEAEKIRTILFGKE